MSLFVCIFSTPNHVTSYLSDCQRGSVDLLSLQGRLSPGFHDMGTQHGSKVTVVCPELLHQVRLRSDLGYDTGTVFLQNTNENKLRVNKNQQNVTRTVRNERLVLLPVKGFGHDRLRSCQYWTPLVLPSLLWCERPLQQAEEESTSLSPKDDGN